MSEKNLSHDEWNSLLNDIDEPVPTHMDGPSDHEIKEAIKRAERTTTKERGRIICEEALRTINGERQDQYGNPEDTFGKIAALWSAYLFSNDPIELRITPAMVADMMCLLKIAREKGGKGKKDNIVDLVGYAALAASMRGYDE
jgi:hypothetical protein